LIGAGILGLLRDFGKSLARKIKNEQQLTKALQDIKQVGYDMPTMIRKATKLLVSKLPRRGGPGRQPKLSPPEAAQVCDQIAVFIRQNHNLKQALQKVAELTPTLLGKKVGARTLQKAWDKRGELST
jgi:type II secretory pathway component PulF